MLTEDETREIKSSVTGISFIKLPTWEYSTTWYLSGNEKEGNISILSINSFRLYLNIDLRQSDTPNLCSYNNNEMELKKKLLQTEEEEMKHEIEEF